MKKHWVGGIIAGSLLTAGVPGYASAQEGANLVPLRVIAETIGASVQWEAHTQTATMQKGGHVVKVKLGSRDAAVDGRTVQMQAAAELLNDRTVVPLDFLNQALQMKAKWNDELGKPMVGDLLGFTAQGVENGSQGAYDLHLKLDDSGQFTVTAKIDVQNVSPDAWENTVFYMIPNAFTEAYQDKGNIPLGVDPLSSAMQPKPKYAQLKINGITVDGTNADFSLDYDTLTVPLAAPLQPGQKAAVEVSYQFTPPEPGMRFWQGNGQYSLAQWYPMLATYNTFGKGWNKEPFTIRSESYHTMHSDFKLTYELPAGYALASSSDRDPAAGTTSGEIDAENVRELFVQVYKDPNFKMLSRNVDGVELRVFGDAANDAEGLQETLDTAADAFGFFTKAIGPYPHKQLDIMTNGEGMEYPGIVTTTLSLRKRNEDSYREETIHELAHQWFYGVVADDPYHEGWLDEGLTEFATSLYEYDQLKIDEKTAFRGLRYQNAPSISNRSLDQIGLFVPVSLYFQPAQKLWELSKRFEGAPDAWGFLHAYYEKYPYKQVSTSEFVRFAQTYYPVERDYFTSWLSL